MKLKISFVCAALCLLFTACSGGEASSSAQEDTTPAVTQSASEPQEQTESKEVAETVPSLKEIVGIWKGDVGDGYLWFQEDLNYIIMDTVGKFPDDILVEQDGENVALKSTDGQNTINLTPAGTHVFDALDGLYDAEDRDYQFLIVGDMVYTFKNTGMKYHFDGSTLTLTNGISFYHVPCKLDGDSVQILYSQTQAFADSNDLYLERTHELDDILVNND